MEEYYDEGGDAAELASEGERSAMAMLTLVFLLLLFVAVVLFGRACYVMP